MSKHYCAIDCVADTRRYSSATTAGFTSKGGSVTRRNSVTYPCNTAILFSGHPYIGRYGIVPPYVGMALYRTSLIYVVACNVFMCMLLMCACLHAHINLCVSGFFAKNT